MGESTWRRLEGAGPLILRVCAGATLAAHGYGKVLSLSAFIQKVDGLGIPFSPVTAPLAAFSEFFGGILLVLGWYTRIAGFAAAATMAVAVAVVHWHNGFWNSEKGYEFPLLLGVVSLSLALSGPGPHSLDRWVRKQK